jgi:hypothetical protein
MLGVEPGKKKPKYKVYRRLSVRRIASLTAMV